MPRLSPFDPDYDDLPEILRIFPLPGAIVLPGQVLPLNIFEPRYLNMVTDALGDGRMIGMIQPTSTPGPEPVAVHRVGCGARITAFQETPDGRMLINLVGVCRFVADAELELHRGYRRVRASWAPYRADLDAPGPVDLELDDLEPALRAYFGARQLEPSWDGLKKLEPADLVDVLSMSLPFDPATKQGLVEAMTVGDRGKLVQAALSGALLHGGEAAVSEGAGGDPLKRH